MLTHPQPIEVADVWPVSALHAYKILWWLQNFPTRDGAIILALQNFGNTHKVGHQHLKCCNE